MKASEKKLKMDPLIEPSSGEMKDGLKGMKMETLTASMMEMN